MRSATASAVLEGGGDLPGIEENDTTKKKSLQLFSDSSISAWCPPLPLLIPKQQHPLHPVHVLTDPRRTPLHPNHFRHIIPLPHPHALFPPFAFPILLISTPPLKLPPLLLTHRSTLLSQTSFTRLTQPVMISRIDRAEVALCVDVRGHDRAYPVREAQGGEVARAKKRVVGAADRSLLFEAMDVVSHSLRTLRAVDGVAHDG